MIADAVAHAALDARDRRFDGRFFVGVTSTGIYCRCVCPVRPPKPANRRFYPSAAAAEQAGFRPCLICRPERAPGAAPIDQPDRIAMAALKAIEAGALDGASLEALAARLGVSSRHLRRATQAAFGAGPSQLAQTHRLLTAKRLLQETALPITEVAFAAGFGSVRRFNALFKARYRLAPSDLRRRAPARAEAGEIRLRLSARGLWRPEPTFAALALRALPGVEHADGQSYARTLKIGAQRGWVRVRPTADGLEAAIALTLVPVLRELMIRLRRAFDLDCDVECVDEALARDGALAGDVAQRPGVRIAGGLDPFEIAVRAVVGQQVTLKGGLTLAARLVERFGQPVEGPAPGLSRLFPSPEHLAAAGAEALAACGLTRARARTLAALSEAVAAGGEAALAPAALLTMSGIGPWTADYVALRAFAEPDAAPAGDAVLRAEGLPAAPALSPWRGYAAMRLWSRGTAVAGEPPCPS